MADQKANARILALVEQVRAPKREIDIEDIAKRAWPDATGGGCATCGSDSGCESGASSQLSPVPVQGLAMPVGGIAMPAMPSVSSILDTQLPLPHFAWPRESPVEQPEIRSAEAYIETLRGRDIKLIIFGEYVPDFVDNPLVWPSINAVAETYRLGTDTPELGTCIGFSGVRMSRFLHVCESAADLVKQGMMQRELGRRTGTCFQRCVGMDATNAMWATTYDIDKAHGTNYHKRFHTFVAMAQKKNIVIGGAMTDPKGDRSKSPGQQEDPDLFVHVSGRKPDGTILLRGAKVHQTGTLNSHYMIVMPGGKLDEHDKDYAVACAIPVDAKGLTYIYGRQSCDLRALEGSEIDQGNANYGGQEAVIVFEDVEVPPEMVFMDGEINFTQILVERFTAYHRRSYICKAGLGDVMLGAAATIADYNGAGKASHVKDKIVEIAYLNENIAGTALAASYGGKPMPAGNFLPDVMMANICKHNVTKYPYEITRLTHDLAGGLLVTLPSDKEFNHDVAGPMLEKYLKAKKGVTVENRRRILRLIECMTMGRNAVGYLSESMHGAGSPQAQRVMIQKLMEVDKKKQLAKRLAGISE